jgi:beta-carotene ketolase (CrtW type)
VNDVLGRIAITLYAYFDYNMLHKKHWEHHNFTGQPGKDPDFHRGNKNLLVWYGR